MNFFKGEIDATEDGAPRAAWRLSCAALSLSLILSGNAVIGLYSFDGLIDKFSRLVVLLIVCVMIFALWHKHGVSGLVIRRCLLWALMVAALYTVVWFSHAQSGGKLRALLFALIMIAPIFWVLLRGDGIRRDVLFRMFSSIVAVLAGISLALWLLGPIGGVLQPTGYLESSWAAFDSSANTMVPHYFYLLFLPQTTVLAGVTLARNCGIFTEAPMYSFMLSMALLGELFQVERPRKFIAVLLAVTIVSTISTAGMVLVIAIAAQYVTVKIIGYARSLDAEKRKAVYISVAVVCVAVLLIATRLVLAKAGSSSGTIRKDDYVAGVEAWLQSPLVGNGMNSQYSIIRQMNPARTNTGFSNSPTYLLALGGLCLIVPYLLAFVGFFYRSDKRTKLFGVGLVYLWTLVISAFLPLMAFSMGMGVSQLLWREDESGESVYTLGEWLSSFGRTPCAFAIPIVLAFGMACIYPYLPCRYSAVTKSTVRSLGDEASEAVAEKLKIELKNAKPVLAAIDETGHPNPGDFTLDVDVDSNTAVVTVRGPSPESTSYVANAALVRAVDGYKGRGGNAQFALELSDADNVTMVDKKPMYILAVVALGVLISVLLCTPSGKLVKEPRHLKDS